MTEQQYDAIVIGSGPAGQNAAITAANLGARTLIVEREIGLGGACLRYGTIPSKSLRETAVVLSSLRRRTAGVYEVSQDGRLHVESLMNRLNEVLTAHQQTTRRYLEYAGVENLHGRAEFVSPNEICVSNNYGHREVLHADRIFIATGSKPRTPPDIPVDHENILDSDSILSLAYLPQSLTIFGGGVIACEYASTFACLGIQVTMIDRYPTPLGFLDSDLVVEFTRQLEANNVEFIGESTVSSVRWDGVSQVVTDLKCGRQVTSDKAFVALGRVSNTKSLQLENAGLEVTDRGFIEVDESYRTSVPSIWAIGDVIGPPALASCSMHQGRCAASHAFGAELTTAEKGPPPMGIYTIPEIASIGLDEQSAKKLEKPIRTATVSFSDLARGQIMASNGGMLKLVADDDATELLGVQIVGEGAAELVHVGQMAIANSMTIRQISSMNFNFPTLAEAYRLAALEIIHRSAEKAVDVKPENAAVESLSSI